MNDIINEILFENIDRSSCNCKNCSSCRSRMAQEVNFAGIMPSVAPSEQEFEIIGTVDGRKRINSTHKVPFRWICRILASYRNPSNSKEIRRFIGTGVLVSPRHVLTCGHNIVNTVKFSGSKPKKVKAFKWEISPGMKDAGTRPFGTYPTSIAETTDSWKKHLAPGHDLGIIKLNTAVGYQRFKKIYNAKLGYWGSKSFGKGTRIIPFNQSSQNGKKMNLAGFPIDQLKGNGNQMYWDADYIVNTSPTASSRLFYYNTDTCGGNSGSPIWLTNTSNRSRFLIGIHTGPCIPVKGSDDCKNVPGLECNITDSAPKRTSNRGVFLSASVIDKVKDWIKNI